MVTVVANVVIDCFCYDRAGNLGSLGRYGLLTNCSS